MNHITLPAMTITRIIIPIRYRPIKAIVVIPINWNMFFRFLKLSTNTSLSLVINLHQRQDSSACVAEILVLLMVQ